MWIWPRSRNAHASSPRSLCVRARSSARSPSRTASSRRPPQQSDLAQPGDPLRLVDEESHPRGPFDRLLEQRQGLGDTSREAGGIGPLGSDPGKQKRAAGLFAEAETALEHGDGLLELPLAHPHTTKSETRGDARIRVVDLLGDPACLFSADDRLGEFADLGEAEGQVGARDHGRAGGRCGPGRRRQGHGDAEAGRGTPPAARIRRTRRCPRARGDAREPFRASALSRSTSIASR